MRLIKERNGSSHLPSVILSRFFKYRLWGGEELYDYLNIKKLATEKIIGECWFIADRELDQTKIANGAA